MYIVFAPYSLEILQQFTAEFAYHSQKDPESQLNPSFLEKSSVSYFIQQLMDSIR